MVAELPAVAGERRPVVAVVAVGIGFALQNILQNFVSGIILLAERSIKETDVLEVDGRTIEAEKGGVRATVARTRHQGGQHRCAQTLPARCRVQ